MYVNWVKDTDRVSPSHPCFPHSQSVSSCPISRTVLPQLTRPPGPNCPCGRERPMWSICQVGTHLQYWGGPRSGAPLELLPHHSQKLGTKKMEFRRFYTWKWSKKKKHQTILLTWNFANIILFKFKKKTRENKDKTKNNQKLKQQNNQSMKIKSC